MKVRTTARWLMAALTVASSVTLTGCADPLATGQYRGEPLIRVGGQILLSAEQFSQPLVSTADLRVALFWTGGGTSQSLYEEDSGRIVEQQAVTQGVFPARYAMTLYLPPSEDALQPVEGGQGRMGVALPLLYWDENRNGVWDRNDEHLAGGTPDHAILYTPEGVVSDQFEEEIGPGYHLVLLNRCEDDGGQTFMEVVGTDDPVDLTVTFDVWRIVPDADCDGRIDVCEDFYERYQETDDARERALLLSDYYECTEDLWEHDLFLSDEECEQFLAAAVNDDGKVSSPELAEIQEYCEEELGLVEDEIHVCEVFLLGAFYCEQVSDEECADDLGIIHELCWEAEASEICRSFFITAEQAEEESKEELEDEFWGEFGACIWDGLESDYESACVRDNKVTCDALVDPYVDRETEVPEAVLEAYQTCEEEYRDQCRRDF